MLQWRNWHTRQIQTLFSPGSTPGWSTIFETLCVAGSIPAGSTICAGMQEVKAGGL